MDIQWYPGHMTKSIRMMQEQIGLVDMVIELLDARIPNSSKNPDIDRLARNKKRLLILNKADLADRTETEKWRKHYSAAGFVTLEVNALSRENVSAIAGAAMELMKEKLEREKKRGRIYVPVRAMIAGVPNVGKSTLINCFVGKASAKTGNKPGVTRGRQWIRLKRGFELLDTPGLLWPKFDDPQVGVRLAITGAISYDIGDDTELARQLIEIITPRYPQAIAGRYGIPSGSVSTLEAIAQARSYEKHPGEPDTERAASVLLGDFRQGKLGRISLETVD
jgi:ribosome biogenesis GTPase A